MKCPDCGFSYIPEIQENVQRHNKYHDKMINGIPAIISEETQIVWQKENCLISVVNFFSELSQRKIAEEVGIVANRDTPYDSSPYSAEENLNERNVHVFLYHHAGRIIGFLLIEKRTQIWYCTWLQYDQKQASQVMNIPFLWSVGLIWVNRNHRSKGIAYKLINSAASFFNIKIGDLGWYAPPITPAGEEMLRKIYTKGYYIAKGE